MELFALKTLGTITHCLKLLFFGRFGIVTVITWPIRLFSKRASTIQYYSDGTEIFTHYSQDIVFKTWWKRNPYGAYGILHREGAPAWIAVGERGYRTETWYKDGLIHREDGPAVILNTEGKTEYHWGLEGFLLAKTDHAQLAKKSSLERLCIMYRMAMFDNKSDEILDLIAKISPRVAKNMHASKNLV